MSQSPAVATDNTPPFLRETLGRAVGWLWSPVIALAAAARRARMFHPDGIVLRARVEPNTSSEASSEMKALASRLAGPAVVRFSSALWKGEGERVDALGIAVRFGARDETTFADGNQDLLLATIRSPFTMLVAPFTTNAHDFLGNTYFAVAPFDVEGIGRAKLRLVPERAIAPGPSNASRREKLQAAAHARVSLFLEVRHTWRPGWAAVARLVLEEELDVNQEALRFDPLRSGRGLVPRGFVHALRRGAYAASQAARPKA